MTPTYIDITSILANCPYFGGTVPLFGAKFPTVPLLSLFFMPPKCPKFCIFDPKLCYFSPLSLFLTENPTFLGILSLFLIMTGWQLCTSCDSLVRVCTPIATVQPSIIYLNFVIGAIAIATSDMVYLALLR